MERCAEITQLGIICISLWYAWRYSKTEIDPDWAMFNLEGFTGAWYGRNYLDCKSPLIHLWYYGLSLLLGRNVRRIKFAHHLLISLPGAVVGGWAGLAFVILVNTGWLLSFHGGVGAQPAGLIFLALAYPSAWISTTLIMLAIAFEPKCVFALAAPILKGWYGVVLVEMAAAGTLAVGIKLLWPQAFDWLWEANVVITRRMTQMRYRLRKEGMEFGSYWAKPVMFLAPWALIGSMNKPDWKYWLPAILYLALIYAGVAVRANHFTAMVPWIALALPPVFVILLAISEALSSGFYGGDVWDRYYTGLKGLNEDARKVGEWLREKTGTLWVNGIHTAIYIHSGKRPFGGLCEQIEIRENAPERRAAWRNAWKERPPDWVVEGSMPGWEFKPVGYELAAQTNTSKVYRKAGD